MIRRGAIVAALALACFVAAHFLRGPEVVGAYFDPSTSTVSADYDLLSPSTLREGTVWFGAGCALAVAALLLAASGLVLRDRVSVPTPAFALLAVAGAGCIAVAATRGPFHDVDGFTSYAPLSDDQISIFDLWQTDGPYLSLGAGAALLLVVPLLALGPWLAGRVRA